MRFTLLFILLCWPQFDQSEPAEQPEQMLFAKVCPNGYDCQKMKWGWYRIRKR
jgi:hypothetical protein